MLNYTITQLQDEYENVKKPIQNIGFIIYFYNFLIYNSAANRVPCLIARLASNSVATDAPPIK